MIYSKIQKIIQILKTIFFKYIRPCYTFIKFIYNKFKLINFIYNIYKIYILIYIKALFKTIDLFIIYKFVMFLICYLYIFSFLILYFKIQVIWSLLLLSAIILYLKFYFFNFIKFLKLFLFGFTACIFINVFLIKKNTINNIYSLGFTTLLNDFDDADLLLFGSFFSLLGFIIYRYETRLNFLYEKYKIVSKENIIYRDKINTLDEKIIQAQEIIKKKNNIISEERANISKLNKTIHTLHDNVDVSGERLRINKELLIRSNDYLKAKAETFVLAFKNTELLHKIHYYEKGNYKEVNFIEPVVNKWSFTKFIKNIFNKVKNIFNKSNTSNNKPDIIPYNQIKIKYEIKTKEELYILCRDILDNMFLLLEHKCQDYSSCIALSFYLKVLENLVIDYGFGDNSGLDFNETFLNFNTIKDPQLKAECLELFMDKVVNYFYANNLETLYGEFYYPLELRYNLIDENNKLKEEIEQLKRLKED